MFAHRIRGFTGPDDVVWTEVTEPATDGGVVIDVAAAGVSFADLLQTKGAYQMKVPLPYTPGMDAAGVIRSAPPGAGLAAGQRVAVLLSYGCWQEVIAAPAARVLPLPDDMSLQAGAAAPLNYLTALFALVRRAKAQPGETLLVHGAAGGVGTAAVQVGRALGLRTVAVVGDEAKEQFAVQHGAHHAVLSSGWLAAVREVIGERAVDIVLDPVGGDRMTDSLRSLAPEGRLVIVGFSGGEIPVVKVNRLLLGNTGVLGAASREFFEQQPAKVADLWARLLRLRRAGALYDPPVQLYPFADAPGALRAIAHREATGKVVLSRQTIPASGQRQLSMFVLRRRRPRAAPAQAVAPVPGLPRPVRPAARPPAPRFISWTALAMLTVGSVGYLGSAPALAVYGLASVFLYVLPAFVFLVPVSLVAAELASGWPGGVYNWVSEGISDPMGLLAVWCQFAQTIFYYPALLAYVASTLAYIVDPGLASNGVYNAIVIIVLFWGGVLLVSRGQALVARLGSGGTLVGTLIPAAILLALGIAYLLQPNHPAAPMTASHLLPAWNGLASIVLIVNSFFTYAGIEVNAVHVDELRNPGREFPRSIFLAMALVLAVFIGPTLAISWVIPSAQISFTAGVMQAFDSLFTHFGAGFAVPLIAIALAVGALAGMISWLDGPSEGLLRIGREQGFLPPYFQKVDSHGIEVRIIAAQGIVITLIALLYAFIPSVSHAYWIFAAMATQVYLIMYVLMFIAAIRLRHSQPDRPRGYRAPALGLLCLLGVVSSVTALAIGFIAPSQFGHLNPLTYAVVILAGILAIGILPPLLMHRLRKPAWRAAGGPVTS